MTFNVCNLGSKYLYFNRAYVVSSSFGWTHLYGPIVSKILIIYYDLIQNFMCLYMIAIQNLQFSILATLYNDGETPGFNGVGTWISAPDCSRPLVY